MNYRANGELFIFAHINSPDSACWAMYGPYEHIQGLVDLYNSGERFIDSEC